MASLRICERRNNFDEIELGYTEDTAKEEAERCLECSCKAAYDCELRKQATDYAVEQPPVRKDRHYYPLDKSHPFIERDPNKCIGCGRCARICVDVMGIGALSVNYRVGTVDGHGGSLLSTACISCGQCVAGCPVGALTSKVDLLPSIEVKTVCPYCGVGCGMYLGVRGSRVVSARGDDDNPVNRGNLCVKGRFGYGFIDHPERLEGPLINKYGVFKPAAWEEAVAMVAEKFSGFEPAEVGVIASGRAANEDNYILQKFARSAIGTNNVDNCARL